MRIPLLTLVAAAGLVAFAAADRRAAAQQPPASAAESSSSSSAPAEDVRHRPEVIVTGDRAEFESKISAFVNHLTDFSVGDSTHSLARWVQPVCPLVTGLPKGMGEYILLQVSEAARAAGAPIAGEKCHANLFIIVTKKPEEYLREQEKRHGADVFGGAAPILIDEFIATPRPVRTWYDTVEMTPEGLPMLIESFPGISIMGPRVINGQVVFVPVRPGDPEAALTNPWSQASHLVLNAIWAIKKVYVVVDPTRFKGVKLGQLADYVSLAGLAQVKLDTHLPDDPTILALFDKDPQTASAGMTDWDRAFLKSMYATEQKSVLQRRLIARDMDHELVP